MPAGRPTKYQTEFCEQLIQHMSEGLSFDSFSAVIHVDRDTTYEWVKIHSEFSDAKKRGREAQILFYEKIGRSAMAGQIEGFNSTAFVWMTKNMLGWRDRQDLEITGKDGQPIEIQRRFKDLPDQELLKLLPDAVKLLKGADES